MACKSLQLQRPFSDEDFKKKFRNEIILLLEFDVLEGKKEWSRKTLACTLMRTFKIFFLFTNICFFTFHHC